MKNIVAVYRKIMCVKPSIRFALGLGVCDCYFVCGCHIARYLPKILLLFINLNNSDDSITARDVRPCVCASEFYVFRCDNLFHIWLVCWWHLEICHIRKLVVKMLERIYSTKNDLPQQFAGWVMSIYSAMESTATALSPSI